MADRDAAEWMNKSFEDSLDEGELDGVYQGPALPDILVHGGANWRPPWTY